MSGLLTRASLRELWRHKAQTLLSLLGIALGVAVMVAVELANESARRAFQISMQSLTGKATHQVTAVEPAGIPEAVFSQLRRQAAPLRATPVIEGLVRINGESFRLFGVDPFSDGQFRGHSESLVEGELRQLLLDSSAVMMTGRDAQRLRLEVGDTLLAEVQGTEQTLKLAGLIVSDDQTALEGLLLADVAAAQEILGNLGRLDRIELILDPDEATALERALPAGLTLQTLHDDYSAQANMTAAFHTNLAAMGLLALLVGGLLVYNTVSFSVLRRRQLLGLMRVTGVTRGGVFRMVMIEALVFGVIGSLIGIALGALIGTGLVKLVTRTINDLYFVLTVSSLLISNAVLLKGFAIGVIAALLAALGPAWDAAHTAPSRAMHAAGVERQMSRAAPWLVLAGVLVIGLGVALLALPSQSLILAFGALFLVIIGYALCVPGAVLLLTRLLLAPVTRVFGRTGQLATRNIGAGLSRSGVAVAALAVAVSATVGVGTMVNSFRDTVNLWLEQTLTSDLYVSLADSQARSTLSPALLSSLRTLPGVVSVSTGRPGELSSSFGKLPMLALGKAPHVKDGFRFRETNPDAWESFRDGRSVLVSEALAYHHGLALNDSIELQGPDGPLSFMISAIFSDYSSDRGLLVLDRDYYATAWRDPGVTTAGLSLAKDADRDQLMAQVRRLTSTSDIALQVSANADIRGRSMEVFDRTFAITHVLRLLAIGVAFVGVLSALLALQLDRRREHATLRALGVTPGQLGALMSLECGLMGLIAGLLSLPLGWATAQLLIHVINKRSFGWSMQSWMSAGVFAEALALALIAALLAGLYPAWRLARMSPAGALRDE